MKNVVRRSGVRMLLVAGMVVAGCGGEGQTVRFDVVPKTPAAQMAQTEPVKIVVEPFEDRRPERSRVGMRSHLWGGVTYFNVTGDKVGDMYAKALADRLKAKGWQDRTWDVRVAPAGSATDADIVIGGQVVEFTANAKSRPFSTALTTSSKVMVSARNNSDRSTTNRTIEGAQTDTVFWYADEDVQELLTATVKDTISRFLEDTTISQRALRPTR